MRLAYFVHDLGDPAVARRLRMLRLGGLEDVALLGFRRAAVPLAEVVGVPTHDLGQTGNGQFIQRIAAVLQNAMRLQRLRDAVAGVDVVMARNLEMLVLAALARRRFALNAQLVYECLDIHRMMVSPSAVGATLRAVEGQLLRSCDLLVVSSPAFVREHFSTVHGQLPRVELVENKVLEDEVSPEEGGNCGPPLPWRIGWFGVIRCRRSLHLLAALCRAQSGRVKVIIRGRPARDSVPDFDDVVAGTPGMEFFGSYDRSGDLAAMYRDVHLTWAMDFYESGANSKWLLPNRLYEGCLYGSVPIALRSVETGRWLEARGAGLLLEEPVEDALPALLGDLSAERFEAAQVSVAAIPRQAFVASRPECSAFVKALSWRLADASS
jgi:succinoglycan biosynthesis protein ExoL